MLTSVFSVLMAALSFYFSCCRAAGTMEHIITSSRALVLRLQNQISVPGLQEVRRGRNRTNNLELY